jgi:hypothetical protein
LAVVSYAVIYRAREFDAKVVTTLELALKDCQLFNDHNNDEQRYMNNATRQVSRLSKTIAVSKKQKASAALDEQIAATKATLKELQQRKKTGIVSAPATEQKVEIHIPPPPSIEMAELVRSTLPHMSQPGMVHGTDDLATDLRLPPSFYNGTRLDMHDFGVSLFPTSTAYF